MRNTFDFAPLFRSTIGFDRMLDTLESASRVTSIDNVATLRHRQDERGRLPHQHGGGRLDRG